MLAHARLQDHMKLRGSFFSLLHGTLAGGHAAGAHHLMHDKTHRPVMTSLCVREPTSRSPLQHQLLRQ